MNKRWTSEPICGSCWNERNPEKLPDESEAKPNHRAEYCIYCRNVTKSGIYIRYDNHKMMGKKQKAAIYYLENQEYFELKNSLYLLLDLRCLCRHHPNQLIELNPLPFHLNLNLAIGIN